MRALSLTSLAALLLFTACSDTTAPPEPETADLETAGTLAASIVVNERFPSEPYVFEGCGETFTYVGSTDHITITETVTPSGKYHWIFHIKTLGATITADPSGDVYRANPGAGKGALHEDLDGNKYGWAGEATIVAKGVNVDKRLKYKEQNRVLVTPDGTVIHDFFVIEVECR
jgi:hypothetical protein